MTALVLLLGLAAAGAGRLVGSHLRERRREVERLRRVRHERLRARLEGVQARRRLRLLDQTIAQAMTEHVARRRGTGR